MPQVRELLEGYGPLGLIWYDTPMDMPRADCPVSYTHLDVYKRQDTLIEPMQKSGFMAESEGEMTVVLDTNLTPELIEEGFVREVISKIQTMRKEAGYEVTDRICVTCATDEKLAGIIARGEKEICRAVLAEKLEMALPAADAYVKEWNINGENAVLATRKA